MNKLIISLAAAGFICAITPAAAAPATPGHSCPAEDIVFVLWDVNTEPYAADNAVDEAGNADGWVCAQPHKIVLDEDGNPFQIYNFIDNRVVGPH